MSLADLPLFARPSPPEVSTASLERVTSRIGAAIVEFCAARVDQTFHADELRAAITAACGVVAPARLIPGAFVEATPSGVDFAPPPPDERWQVRQRGELAMRTLAVGPSPREAIARAIFLFGGGR